MTDQEKREIWAALYKCTRNGYPGATYQQYDSPKDPRVRGGRYPWTQAQLRDIYEQLVKWGDLNEPTAAWRELEKYKTKIPPACLMSIFQSITFGPPPPPLSGFRLTYTSLSQAPVTDPLDVNQWNTLFNLPADGPPFLGVYQVDPQSIILIASGNFTDKPLTELAFSPYLLMAIDEQNYFVDNVPIFTACESLTTAIFNAATEIPNRGFNSCTNLSTISFDSLLIISSHAFGECTSLTDVSLNAVQTIGDRAFENCYGLNDAEFLSVISLDEGVFMRCTALSSIYIPQCTDLGGTPFYNFVFEGIDSNNINATFNGLLATNLSGGPDGDIIYLTNNNTVNITYV